MKRNLWIAALAMMTATACVESQVETPNMPDGKQLTGTIEQVTNVAESRAYFDGEFNFRWQSGDKIGVLVTDGAKYSVSSYLLATGAGEKSATFSGSIGAGKSLSDKIAFPKSVTSALSPSSVTMSLPAEYAYGAPFEFGAVGDASTVLPCWAAIEGNTFTTKHLGGYFVFEISKIPAGADKFEFRITNGKRINGEFTADLTVAEPCFTEAATAVADEQKVTVTFAAAATTTTRCFIVPAPVGEYAYEWYIYADESLKGFGEQESAVNVARGAIVGKRVACSSIGGGEEPEEPQEPTIPNNEIWYTTSDGAVVKPYNTGVFGANIVSNTYNDGKGVITFDGDITKIGNYAFDGCSSLTSVTIPDSVTSIGERAFRECSNLTSVTIGNSVTSIGEWAFRSCSSLTSVTIPDSVTSIGSYAFYYCSSLTAVHISSIEAWCKISFNGWEANPLYYAHNLYLNGNLVADLVIPDSVTSIGDWAFDGCSSLTSVTIPDSVTSIGEDAFRECGSLKSVTIPDSVTEIGDCAFCDCSSLTAVHISSIEAWCKISFNDESDNPLYYAHNLYLNGNLVTDLVIPDSVTSIGNHAFCRCSSLTSVTIPDSVTSIGEVAFESCTGLTSVTIPDSVTSIGYYAFYGCSSLTSITIPDSVTSIRSSAFSGCSSLTAVHISSIEAWCKISFNDWSANPLYYANNLYLNGNLITDLVIPDSVTSIGSYAFLRCSSLTSVTIPDSVTSIGDNAFSGCSSLTSITIPDSVTWIGGSAFYGCSSLTSITIPDSVTWIGRYAFAYCSSLTSVTIPDSVTSIGYDAFRECTGLTSVTIPDSVTSIGYDAFRECTGLTSVYCKPTTPPTGDSYMFDYNASGRKIYVPSGSVSAYKSAEGWSSYSSYIVGYDF